MSFITTLGTYVALLLAASPFNYEYSSQTDAKGQAYLRVQANEDLPAIQVTITSPHKKIHKKIPALKAGKDYTISWQQEVKQDQYSVSIVAGDIQGEASFEIERPAQVGKVSGLESLSTREDIVDRRQAIFRSGFDVIKYEFTVYDTEGDEIHSAEETTKTIKAGEKIILSWDNPGSVFMVLLKVEGAQGQTSEYKVVPWSVELPHTDVNFDSGKAIIKPNEATKVDEAAEAAIRELAGLERVNQAVNGNLQAQLYIIGYTDTVGNGAKNQKLSEQRARAIAEYFRDKGIWAEIYYAGMGERGLRVQTEDNVDEVRNRRATYIVGVDRPTPGGDIPSSWKKLIGARSRPASIQLPPEPKLSSASGGAQSSPASGSQEQEPSPTSTAEPASESPEPKTEQNPPTNWESNLESQPPPEIKEEPGASRKGCSVAANPGLGGMLFGLWVGVTGLSWRRRKRQNT